jgi:hypothetical protein
MKNRCRGWSPRPADYESFGEGIRLSRSQPVLFPWGISRHWGTYISKQNAVMLASNNSFKLKDCGTAQSRFRQASY